MTLIMTLWMKLDTCRCGCFLIILINTILGDKLVLFPQLKIEECWKKYMRLKNEFHSSQRNCISCQ